MTGINQKADFDIQLGKNNRLLALFYTSWCPFCRRFMKIFKENSGKKMFDMILCVKLDDYSNPIWEDYSIENVPTVIFFDKGKVVKRLDGQAGLGLSKSQLIDLLDNC